jgi:transposase
VKRHKKHRRMQKIALRREDLVAIIERAKAVPLSDKDYATLIGAVDTLAFITQELEAKGASLQRLRHMLFGAPTEKTDKIFGDGAKKANPSGSETEKGSASKNNDEKGEGTADEKKTPAPGHGRNGAAAYKGAEKIKVAHPSLKKGDRCPACNKGKVYPMAEPAVLVRILGMAPLTAKVYELDRWRCNLCGEVFTADSPDGVGNEKYDETATAMVGTVKYGAGLPFNRLERLQQGMGIPLPASTQWEIVERGAQDLAPVHTEFINQAAQGTVLHNDDTPAKILELMAENEDGENSAKTEDERDGPKGDSPSKKRTGLYTTGIVSVVGEHRIALFFTGRQHAGENLADVLARRSKELSAPIQMCDALSANTSPSLRTILANCLAHGRRQFVDVVDDFPEECRFVLETLREVYQNDEIARKRQMSAEERLAFHQAESSGHMNSLEEWMKEQIDQRKVEPNSGLGEAIKYMQKHWKKLTLFLREPGAPLDNNICERLLKKAILHRKNSYFYRTQNGAHVGDIYMSLIHTAELCGVEPYPYLVALLRHPESVAENPAAWLPWNYQETFAAEVSAKS